MAPKYKKTLSNPRLYSQHTNNPRELFEYTMGNLHDTFYMESMDFSIDGEFKAVCLSGTDGTSNVDIGPDGFRRIIVRPLGDINLMIPDPRDFDNPDDVNKAILLHRSSFLARADFKHQGTNQVGFGQIVNCYYEEGSITNSEFIGLRYSEPKAIEAEQSYLNIANVEGVVSGPTAFEIPAYNFQTMGQFGGGQFGGGYISVGNPTEPCVKAENIVHLENAMNEFGITNTYARVAILSVIKKESQLCPKNEKMDYSPGRLAEVWGRFSKTGKTVPKGQGKYNYNALATQYARNPEKLANYVYCCKYGNGPPESGDGWKYRGRGFNQITWKGTYEKYSELLGLDLINNPDLLNDPKTAARGAVAFIQRRWKQRANPGKAYRNANPQFTNQSEANYYAARANAGWGKIPTAGLEGNLDGNPADRAIFKTNKESKNLVVNPDGTISLAKRK